jgi:hypothetical protein
MAQYEVQFVSKENRAIDLYMIDDAESFEDALREIADQCLIPAKAVAIEVRLINEA